eukprot:6183825-Pleurochrysis_carterae.AAC.2
MERQISNCRAVRGRERSGGMCSRGYRKRPSGGCPNCFNNDAEARCCRFFPAEKFCHPNLSANPQMCKIGDSRANRNTSSSVVSIYAGVRFRVSGKTNLLLLHADIIDFRIRGLYLMLCCIKTM